MAKTSLSGEKHSRNYSFSTGDLALTLSEHLTKARKYELHKA